MSQQFVFYLFISMLLIKFIADGTMPQVLNQIAGLGGTLSRGSSEIFQAV